jgi:hypothetical protein
MENKMPIERQGNHWEIWLEEGLVGTVHRTRLPAHWKLPFEVLFSYGGKRKVKRVRSLVAAEIFVKGELGYVD